MSVFLIIGMRNNDCRERVLAILERLAGVTEAEVSLLQGRAVVVHGPGFDPEALIAAVKVGGYGVMRD